MRQMMMGKAGGEAFRKKIYAMPVTDGMGGQS